jgi:hypothetical protein
VILWHGNLPIDVSSLSVAISIIKSNPDCWDENYRQWSSFHILDRPESILNDFYLQVANKISSDLTLYNRVQFEQSYWMQIYPPNSKGHSRHDHFSGNELFSWVHFIKPMKPCFHFLVDGQKIYPPHQNAGDFIVFPSWALHAVDDNDSNSDRIVIAGNVGMKTLNTEYYDGKSKFCACHKINSNILVWEIID